MHVETTLQDQSMTDESHESDVTAARPDFTAFYREVYPKVARALAATLRDVELADEAADEAMARCYSRWSTVQRYDNPAGWVYRVGLNWALSKRRRTMREPKFRPMGAPDAPAVADPAIHEALGELDVDLRAVVVCRYMFDWSVQETADALGIRPGTVKSRSHRALEKLQSRLEHMR